MAAIINGSLVLLLVAAAVSAFLLRVLFYKTGFIYAVKKQWRSVEDCFHVYQIFKVPEFNDGKQENLLYRKVSAYLQSLPSIEDSDFTNLFTGRSRHDIVLRLDPNQVVHDTFLGARVSWVNDDTGPARVFALRIRKADKRRILRPYLQHIHTVSDELDQRKRELRLYVNSEWDPARSGGRGRWRSVPFTHPSTLETIAMEPDLKNRVKSDLELFLKSQQYYHRLGRVWKRSFLLYGPSGTGKSSFVAAMANFLSYDVYDIDLSRITDDADLRTLLLETSSRSVIVIEDLDRFLMEKPGSVSLSGILNFMDGILSSCCAEERIMVFTMNSKDHIDPAILRPGRIDVHIHFPLCDFSSFRSLANSCLGVTDHKLFPQVEEIFQTGARLSPAEIGELMITNRNSPNRALKSVITALRTGGDARVPTKIGQRLCEDVSSSADSSGIFFKDSNAIKDIKRLYGFLRIKSSRKSSHSFDEASGQNVR
ncbi:AAA-ATPase At2g46620 [Punica granatum]|uniref:AAA+ ATPase domain-containing protein n=2 Tax=Punica granatum TaxID=22663 RepID=A0A218W767_PUNGR|nr:AAA-ATPase At2g46620 [Punica granatum]OWM68625.1 hypothetical protein CDL15_Pgr023590 [Punica granatum]PKI44952.1 hypothetical protein CRG98_034647 [Punica granatum]